MLPQRTRYHPATSACTATKIFVFSMSRTASQQNGAPLSQSSVSLKRQHQEASTLPLTSFSNHGTQSILKCPCYLPGMWVRIDSWNFCEIMSHDFKCFCYYTTWSKNFQNYCSRPLFNCLLVPISTSCFLLTDLAFNRKAVLYYPRKYFWYGLLAEQNGFYTYTLLWPWSVFHSSGRGCTSVTLGQIQLHIFYSVGSF